LLGTSTTGSSELDVDGGDTDLLALGGNGLRSQHGGVGLDIVKGKHKCHSLILKDLIYSQTTRLGQP
jgi:hypothetical protein